MSFFRSHIGKHRNNANASKGQDRQCLIVVSGIQLKIFSGKRHCLCDLGQISAGGLYAYDVFTFFTRAATVAGWMLQPVRLGTLYMMIGVSGTALAIAV